MIKLEHVVLASPEQMEFIIEGMRNPMNSWDKSDSGYLDHCPYAGKDCDSYDDYYDESVCEGCSHYYGDPEWVLGENDHKLMLDLSEAGTDHRKYMRMMPVYVRITAPLYFWKELDTYKVGTVRNSCSTMHKIHAKEFEMEDFSCEHLKSSFDDYDGDCSIFDSPRGAMDLTVKILNNARDIYLESRDKDDWWQLIQLLPSSYNQTANVMMNYEVLANIYKSRKNHKLDEWIEFCKWIETLPYSELITRPEPKHILAHISIPPEDLDKVLVKHTSDIYEGGTKRNSGRYPWNATDEKKE